MTVDTPVIVRRWLTPDGRPGTCFGGRRGRITSVTPAFMVLLDGEERPLFFGAESLFPASAESNHHMPAGE